MLESLFFVSKLTRLLTHISLDKGARRPKPPLQKGGWGIGNISRVVHHHYIKDKKSLPDWEGFTYISVTRLLTHVTLDILKERSDQSPLYRKGVGG